MEKVQERFLRYVAYDTQSKADCDFIPSTEKQKVLGEVLKNEIAKMGFQSKMDDHGYVYGIIPANNGKSTPCLGLIAHMDTSPDLSGADIKVQQIKYAGGDVVLNKEKNIVLSPKDFPYMNEIIGETIICTDGTTLLGADDKAGVAAIMSLAEFISQNPDFKHGEIRIGFTPDEEVGCGADLFDVKGFGADYAYTVDGGTVGEIEYENFNASSLMVTVSGINIHPGSAKARMVNSQLIAMEYNSMLPQNAIPAATEGYEGFFHLDKFEGSVEETKLHYIIRDHDAQKFAEKEKLAKEIGEFLNKKYGSFVNVEIKESYRNMKEKVEPYMFLIDRVKEAIEEAGVTPEIVAIRGGTDGARLSYMGLPCPNLGTGGQNFHGRYEFVTIESLVKNVEILKKLVTKF